MAFEFFEKPRRWAARFRLALGLSPASRRSLNSVVCLFLVLFVTVDTACDRPDGAAVAGLSVVSTLRVPQDYSTIQAAVNAAVSGDVVLVSPGVYNENLVITGKSITLASLYLETQDPGAIAQTIIDGSGSTVITVEQTAGPQTRISGFTIRNGNDGISAAATLSIDNNFFTDNDDAIDYESGGGLCRDNLFVNNADDAIDLDGATASTIESNIIRDNGDDGIEIRLEPYSGSTLQIVIRDNVIDRNREDGIQLIGYNVLTDRQFLIERNQITNNALVGLGLMDGEESDEDFRAASLLERVYLFNNTFAGNRYAVTGGDNLIALNNLFVDSSTIALKEVDGGPTGSIASFNLFWGNTADNSGSNVDESTTLTADPLLDTTYRLRASSPAIDAGTARFDWNNETVLNMSPAEYVGIGPDMGWHESKFELVRPEVYIPAIFASAGSPTGVFGFPTVIADVR